MVLFFFPFPKKITSPPRACHQPHPWVTLIQCPTTYATEYQAAPDFFTINLLDRGADHLTRHIDALRAAVRRTRNQRPFHIDAWIAQLFGVTQPGGK